MQAHKDLVLFSLPIENTYWTELARIIQSLVSPPTMFDPSFLLQYLPPRQPLLLGERMAALSAAGVADYGTAGRKRRRQLNGPEPRDEEQPDAEVSQATGGLGIVTAIFSSMHVFDISWCRVSNH